jgi:hypothetical protein
VRLLLRLLLLVLVALPAVVAVPARAASDADLQVFARRQGLKDVTGFVEAVRSIEAKGRLPDQFVTKYRAEQLGWRPGMDLCAVAPGRSIGGDRFGTRERRLPEAQNRRWTEADLDFVCGRRGAKRLVFSSDGLIYVTVDHYDSFRRVPR